jgi:zinc protease
VLDLAFHLLRTATFPEDELERLKRSLRTRVEDDAASPGYLVRNTLQRHDQPWGPDDIRYTPTNTELLHQVDGLKRTQLQQFHDRFYGAGHLSLAVVGDFDPDALEHELRTGLNGWQTAPAYERLADPWYAMTPKTFRIPAPGKANAEYRAALPLKLRDTDPHWPALMLANYLIGGSEDSRLWQAIRVRGSLSYGVGSAVNASSFEDSGAWTLYASTAAQNADALQKAMRSVLDQTLKTGFTQAEVDQGVQSLLNYLALGRSDDAYLAGRWIDYLDTDRSFAWQQHIIEQLRGLKADQVNAAMRDWLKPDALSIAVAADPDPKP